MMEELVPHVDKLGNRVGVVSRSDAYKNGYIHMGSHGFMKRADGKILIQRRNSTKSTWPGCYDLSVAETVKPDESFSEALKRGLFEELKITKVSSLKIVREKYYQEYRFSNYLINSVICLFEFEYNGEIQIDHDEVMEASFMSAEEIDTLISEKPALCTPWLVADWEYCKKT